MGTGRGSTDVVEVPHTRGSSGVGVRLMAAPKTLQLYCLAHAGGNSAFFRRWRRAGGDKWQVTPLELKGHGHRIHEDPYPDFPSMIVDLARYVSGEPFALFGHSFGGLVAFELARHLESHGLFPHLLVISACDPPHEFRKTDRNISELPNNELIEEMMLRGGSPPAVLENKMLLDMMLPVLKRDFKLMEAYKFRHENPLQCPVLIVGGRDDPSVPPARLADWKRYTEKPFQVRLFPGNHFYLIEQEAVLIDFLDKCLTYGTLS